ncbi:MAG: LemA family protein [Bacteroidia bacterium]|nr:LemA family protein [Bacteroidia bacterium]
MKKLIPIAIIVVIALAIGSWLQGSYNTIITLDETVTEQWAKVESQYQRRLDLIPNLVSTVKGYADFEQETLTKVIEARAGATQVKIDPSNITPEQLQSFQSSQNNLSGALSRLLLVVERYPDLKANKNFLELQAQLEGTENRITVARNDFNAAAKDYNSHIRKFPTTVIANMFGFDTKAYFTAEEGSEKAPKVEF